MYNFFISIIILAFDLLFQFLNKKINLFTFLGISITEYLRDRKHVTNTICK